MRGWTKKSNRKHAFFRTSICHRVLCNARIWSERCWSITIKKRELLSQFISLAFCTERQTVRPWATRGESLDRVSLARPCRRRPTRRRPILTFLFKCRRCRILCDACATRGPNHGGDTPVISHQRCPCLPWPFTPVIDLLPQHQMSVSTNVIFTRNVLLLLTIFRKNWALVGLQCTWLQEA